MYENRCFTFTHTLSRLPGKSIAQGLRAENVGDPDPGSFLEEHHGYIQALQQAGVKTTVLPAAETFPDSVFIEDAALCFDGIAVVLRPGASTRFGEAAALQPDLQEIFPEVIELDGSGYIDGGDILLSDDIAFIGLSDRTDAAGIAALTPILNDHGYKVQIVNTPGDVLHFKSDCGILDSETIFATKALAASGCFQNFTVIEAIEGEEAAANLIRVNDYVILRTGFSKTKALLEQHGFKTITTSANEAEKVDGGLSCMSLRFSL